MAGIGLTDVPGIGAGYARKLEAAGIASIQALARASLETLTAIPTMGPARAARFQEAARALVGRDAAARPTPPAKRTGKKKGGKSKDEKRRKKKNKKDDKKKRGKGKKGDKGKDKKRRKKKKKKK